MHDTIQLTFMELTHHNACRFHFPLNMSKHTLVLFLLVLLTFTLNAESWKLFPFWKTEPSSPSIKNHLNNRLIAKFDSEALDDHKALELLKNVREKLGGSHMLVECIPESILFVL